MSATWGDLVREVAHQYHIGWSALTDEQVDVILWEHTAFPLAPVDHVRCQVDEFFARLPEAR